MAENLGGIEKTRNTRINDKGKRGRGKCDKASTNTIL